MGRIGMRLEVSYRNKINTNNVSGKALKKSTIALKTDRGSSYPSIKLKEGGGLAKQLRHTKTSKEAKIGYFGEKHIKFKDSDKDIDVSTLARIHHYGNSKLPERKILEREEEQRDLIREEIRHKLRG